MNKSNLLIGVVAIIAMISGIFFYQYQRFDFKDISGNEYRWSVLNQEIVVVNYFAEWCAPCIKEVPELNTLHEWVENQQDMTFVAVSYDNLTANELADVGDKYDMRFPLIADVGENFPINKPQYLPATFIIKDTVIHGPLLGEQTFETLKDAIVQIKN